MGQSPCPTSADGGKPCLGNAPQGVNAEGRGEALHERASPYPLSEESLAKTFKRDPF